MSVRIQICCDNCRAATQPSIVRIHDLRDELKLSGWTEDRVRGLRSDFCPKCSKKRAV